MKGAVRRQYDAGALVAADLHSHPQCNAYRKQQAKKKRIHLVKRPAAEQAVSVNYSEFEMACIRHFS